MAPPLRRALAGAVNQLKDLRPESAVQVLSLLIAPAREIGGAEAGEAIALAAQVARHQVSRAAGPVLSARVSSGTGAKG